MWLCICGIVYECTNPKCGMSRVTWTELSVGATQDLPDVP